MKSIWWFVQWRIPQIATKLFNCLVDLSFVYVFYQNVNQMYFIRSNVFSNSTRIDISIHTIVVKQQFKQTDPYMPIHICFICCNSLPSYALLVLGLWNICQFKNKKKSIHKTFFLAFKHPIKCEITNMLLKLHELMLTFLDSASYHFPHVSSKIIRISKLSFAIFITLHFFPFTVPWICPISMYCLTVWHL